MTFKTYVDRLTEESLQEPDYTILDEGKKVGIIYHFTKKNNIKLLINPPDEWKADVFEFISMNGVISTTRNHNASDNIINKTTDLDLCTYNIRIAFDGDAISNKYKIRPLAGLKNNDTDVFNQHKNDNRVLRSSAEAEEAIYSNKYKTFKLQEYIMQIDIYNCAESDTKLFDDVKKLLNNKNINIPVNLVRKFKPIKESSEISNDLYFDISTKGNE